MAALTTSLYGTRINGALKVSAGRRVGAIEGHSKGRVCVCVARATTRTFTSHSRGGQIVLTPNVRKVGLGIGVGAGLPSHHATARTTLRGDAIRLHAAAAASEGEASGKVRRVNTTTHTHPTPSPRYDTFAITLTRSGHCFLRFIAKDDVRLEGRCLTDADPTPHPSPSQQKSSTTVVPIVNKGKLQTRIISALILSAFGLFVTCTGGWVWAVWMAGASYLSAREYFTMVPNMTSELPNPIPKWACDVSIVVCTSFALVLQACGAKTSAVVMTTLGSFAIVAFLLTTKQDEPHFSQYTAALFGIIYCGALPAFWVKLRALAFSNQALTNIAVQASGSKFVDAWPKLLGGPECWTTGLIVTVITVSCIIASDVGAYAFGKTFGKTQMIKVSPNKTVEGAAGGLLCTTLTAFGLRQLFGWHAGVIQTLVLGALVFFAAVAGDLMESVMKRNAGMKDSGDIIPGHGGFLDRFDSYMFTGISVYFYIVTVMPYWFVGMVL